MYSECVVKMCARSKRLSGRRLARSARFITPHELAKRSRRLDKLKSEDVSPTVVVRSRKSERYGDGSVRASVVSRLSCIKHGRGLESSDQEEILARPRAPVLRRAPARQSHSAAPKILIAYNAEKLLPAPAPNVASATSPERCSVTSSM